MNPEAEALLGQLRDIHTPGIGGFPIAPIWFLVVLVVAALIYALALFFIRRRHQRLQFIWRDQAMQELEQIRNQAANQSASATAAACSRLLRRITLVALPRKKVAGLTGKAWLSTLDKLHGSSEFSNTQATHLLETAYLDPGVTAANSNMPGGSSDESETSADSVMQPLLQLTEEMIHRVANKVTIQQGGKP